MQENLLQKSVGVYRFGDCVAMHSQAEEPHVVTRHGEPVASCPTIYIDVNTARQLATALWRIADDVLRCPTYSQSTLPSVKIERETHA